MKGNAGFFCESKNNFEATLAEAALNEKGIKWKLV